MALPIVAIIGRPNVGKSSLLNALAGRMISIVEPTAGVTRDRVSTIVEWRDRYFELVDTGGYGIVDRNDLTAHIEAQIRQAIDSADLIIFLVDIRNGLLPLDEKLAQLLRRENSDVILVANKADTAAFFPAAAEFIRLGFGEALCISATNNLNKNLLLDHIVEKLDHLPSEKPGQAMMKIAVVGKRNAGKSCLINAILGEERVIVSEVPGTTRDAVDVRFERNGKTIIIIDTAGVRKKGKFDSDIEFYSYTRVTRSIKRADVVLFIIDSTLPVSQVDKKLAGFIIEQYKACILVINKWDLAQERTTHDDYENYLTAVLPGLKYAPIAFTIATEAKNVEGVLDLAADLFSQATCQVPTSQLNKAIELITAERYPSASGKKALPKIYYVTQVAVNPVTILMFVNKPELFEENYRRFLVGRLRESLPMKSVPIRLLARSHRAQVSSEGKD